MAGSEDVEIIVRVCTIGSRSRGGRRLVTRVESRGSRSWMRVGDVDVLVLAHRRSDVNRLTSHERTLCARFFSSAGQCVEIFWNKIMTAYTRRSP